MIRLIVPEKASTVNVFLCVDLSDGRLRDAETDRYREGLVGFAVSLTSLPAAE